MLSPEQFAEIVSLVETTHAPEAAQDHEHPSVRRAQRVPYRCRVTISLAEGDWAGAARTVELCDISCRGISFTYEHLLPLGATFVLKLEGSTGKFASILSSVVHCKQVAPGSFQYGAEFTCVMDGRPEAGVDARAADLRRISSSILN